jgi:DNA-directed RNA polymerase subunit RPC12/RpoP
MAIPVTCGCGSEFEARDEHAGKQATCPDCGARLPIPNPHVARSPGPPPASGQQFFRCVDCDRRLPASEVVQDEDDIVCHDCLQEVYVPAKTGIMVHPSFFPLMWLLFLTTPKFVIDGREYSVKWFRTEFFPLAPGRHQVGVFVSHLFGPAGKQTARIRVRANRVLSLGYQYLAFWAPASLAIR